MFSSIYIVCFSLRRLLNRLNSVSSILDRRARRQVTLYSSQSNEPLRTYSRFKDTAYCGTYRRDGKLLVAGCEDGDVRLFDCKAKSMLRVFKAHQGLVEGWSRVGRGLVVGWSRVGPGLVESWSRVGRGLVQGWSRVGRGLVEGWSRVGRGLVESWSRVGRGLVEGWSRVGRGLVQGWSRVGLGLV